MKNWKRGDDFIRARGDGEMKAIKYQVKICDSTLDLAHGFAYPIEEIFVPKEGIAFNIGNGRLNVFKTDKPRGKEKRKEITLKDGLVNKLITLSQLNENCYKLVSSLFLKSQKEK